MLTTCYPRPTLLCLPSNHSPNSSFPHRVNDLSMQPKSTGISRRLVIGQYKQYHNTSIDLPLNRTQPFGLILPGPINSSSVIDQSVIIRPTSYEILESGMILMKNHINLNEQVEIVNICHKLGVGAGGFYRPTYGSGSKLRLHMMSFGRNWHPETKYTQLYRSDGSKPPPVPGVLVSLVQTLIQDARARVKSPYEIPSMCPDICLVNFYSVVGGLGLHQDNDESYEGLTKGLPVVSISIGDSCEFLYGHTRDKFKARKVLLESGDVLLFGGKSRLIYHGVNKIIPDSTPLSLLQKTMLKPGRLNLTFRQF
ncbi:hypothetical protein QVD17_10340 [Tagetes erecta]|uniref:Fe2OG dioxygenase domain-containing protein n=1 Tax=Tagetes erecta TaxID=13708 RepID=A0AAD8L0W7_TARER|nr:hypothetical protein QVD17_10340 [Tagetes erecta]